MSDKIVGKTESPQQPCTPINNPAPRRTRVIIRTILGQNLLGVIPAPTKMLVARQSCPPAKARQGNCGEEALARGLVHLRGVDLSWKQGAQLPRVVLSLVGVSNDQLRQRPTYYFGFYLGLIGPLALKRILGCTKSSSMMSQELLGRNSLSDNDHRAAVSNLERL